MHKLKTCEDYYNFFDSKPADTWTTDFYIIKIESPTSYTPIYRYCAIGHLCKGVPNNIDGTLGIKKRWCTFMTGRAISVNDGNYDYEQLGDTPKERVLNAIILKSAGLWGTANGE